MIPFEQRGAEMMVQKAYKYMMLRLLAGVVAIFVMMSAMVVSSALAGGGESGQRIFTSPQQAVGALVTAVQDNDDENLLDILGPGSEELIFSGDKVADQNGRARFLKAYEETNSITQESEGRAVLIVGSKGYPFPIPIVRQGEAWIFDTLAGKEEILNRRVGRNELQTIEVIQAYTAAQREYACIMRSDGPEFAQRFSSSEGKKDGLYWKAEPGGEESPLGPLIARATEEGYAGDLDREPPESFHGYYYKILKGQGEHAKGGAFDYVVDGKMILGFALVAYPARYGASGIMTFLINQEGVIYEKDLGEDTAMVAAAMTTYDPDATWHMYEESAE